MTARRSQAKPTKLEFFNPAGSLFAKYKDEYSKYGGAITESWSETLDDYDAVATALKLDEGQKLEYLPLILKGDARRLFKNVVRKESCSFDAAVSAISSKFNTPAQQSRIKNHLMSPRIDKFESKRHPLAGRPEETHR